MFLYGEKGKGFTRSICLRPFLFENVGGINNGGRVIRIIGKRYPAVKINSFLMLLNFRIGWASQYRLQKSCLISSSNSVGIAGWRSAMGPDKWVSCLLQWRIG